MAEAIPIIDIGGYLAGRPGALAAVARQVYEALTTVGFFVLTGHDVPMPLIERTLACFDEASRDGWGARDASSLPVYWSGKTA